MGADPNEKTDLVTFNLEKKRVYLRFQGSLTKDQAEELQREYRKAIAEDGPGYTAVSIFEEFLPGTAEVQ